MIYSSTPPRDRTRNNRIRIATNAIPGPLNRLGFDPSRPQNTASNAASDNRYQPSQPHVLKGAARGAALGAVGGAITGNAGKGAGAGAAMGGVAGGFRRRDERREQQSQPQQSAQASQQNQRT